MRPLGPDRRSPRGRLTRRSDLRLIVLRMISMNSLAAFTAEVSRIQGPTPARGASTTAGATAPSPPETPRRLDSLPPQPSAPLPRGSLLDLRI